MMTIFRSLGIESLTELSRLFDDDITNPIENLTMVTHKIYGSTAEKLRENHGTETIKGKK